MSDFEKLGVFYLGKKYDIRSRRTLEDLVLYDSRDLVTHAVCIGMTGSGKTGLCLGLLEEAAIDGIPVIAIDPKGDIGNLLLTFPDLAVSDFEPWVDSQEARRQGKSVTELAAAEASRWSEGLKQWGEDGERIRRLKDACDLSIYTPGASSG
ncbi:MAG: ATP-binding protein, partial [Cyanobacteria bacterium SZAS LIN-2]|nr:ATP-binding protein [Cyanobacteria bacterium SZAS LIN-2]